MRFHLQLGSNLHASRNSFRIRPMMRWSDPGTPGTWTRRVPCGECATFRYLNGWDINDDRHEKKEIKLDSNVPGVSRLVCVIRDVLQW